MKAPKFNKDHWINIVNNIHFNYCLAGCRKHDNDCPMCVASHGYKLKEEK